MVGLVLVLGLGLGLGLGPGVGLGLGLGFRLGLGLGLWRHLELLARAELRPHVLGDACELVRVRVGVRGRG